MDAAGLVDQDLYAWGALKALREKRAASWGATPVFMYGFDDFTELEFRTIEELRPCTRMSWCRCRSSPAGIAFKATATLASQAERDRGRGPAGGSAVSDHYDKGSRAALHALERTLFEAPAADPPDPGDAVRLHRAGGERAEVELCGAEVVAATRGRAAGDVAIVSTIRPPTPRWWSRCSAPTRCRTRWTAHVPSPTAVSGGACSPCYACATKGTADDLLAYLRTPGLLASPAWPTGWRRTCAAVAAHRRGARKLWEATPGRWPLADIDGCARRRGPGAWLQRLDLQAGDGCSRPPTGPAAPLFASDELDDPRAFHAANAALAEMHALAGPTGPPARPRAPSRHAGRARGARR